MPKRPLTTLLYLPLTAGFLTPHSPIIRTNLHGLSEWREEALDSSYTLDAYTPPTPGVQPQTVGSMPILPFPFNDILLPGQTTELNLYEERFHLLFADALENHSVVGMGLFAGGTGMLTMMPVLEIESFERVGYDPHWISSGDGMGNGQILVTVRAVGRAKIVDELEQEEPYMRARVKEIVDVSSMNGVGLVKEKGSGGNVKGELSEVEVGSMIAGSIETLILSLASMEHRWKMAKKKADELGEVIVDKDGNKVSRAVLNAQLEALFNNDVIEGVSLDSTQEEDDEDVYNDDDSNDEGSIIDRRTRYYNAFENAKNCDTQGYISQTIDTKNTSVRTLKDLTAISWAVFCTSTDSEDISLADVAQYNVFKIQALDNTNVLQRLNLGAAMLRMEKKKLKAKLAVVGGTGDDNDGLDI